MNLTNKSPNQPFFTLKTQNLKEGESVRLNKLRIAVVTDGHDGLNDTVAHVFGKAKTFTVIDVENGKIENVKIIDNPAAAYDQGSGPIASKTLAELKVNVVITSQLGPGASKLLDYHKIDTMIVDHSITVTEAISKALSRLSNKDAVAK
jgi:predicted Fe-Mo cluster-binding NifX family protein